MRIITACVEAFLVVVLVALFTVPFIVVNTFSANQISLSSIAQNFSK